MSEICKGYVPQNTDKATTWAMRVFKAWRIERNKVATDKCPDNLLESPDIHNLNRWLSRLGSHVSAHARNPDALYVFTTVFRLGGRVPLGE